jgi:MoxR-like ATPase
MPARQPWAIMARRFAASVRIRKSTSYDHVKAGRVARGFPGRHGPALMNALMDIDDKFLRLNREKRVTTGACHSPPNHPYYRVMNDNTSTLIQALQQNIARVVLGKEDVIRLTIIALLAGEHVLLEDVPGVGKTLMGKALARSVSGEFRRIQFTPDLLPSDITGSSILNPRTQEFTFSPGPVFANIVLADEINRATPRTQSALLEGMCERQVSVDGRTHLLPQPFMVIATQNPVEFEGTYPLPESQLDRFLLRIPMGYPNRAVELQVLTSHREGEPVETLEPVLDSGQIVALQADVRQVAVEDSINQYLLDLVQATRHCDDLQVGVSPRGALALYRAAQASALVASRNFAVPDDVKSLAVPVLAHRIITKGYLHGGQREAVESLIERLIEEVPVPA